MNRLMIRHTMDKPLPYDAEVEWIGGTTFLFVINDIPDVGFITHKTKLVNINVSPTVEFLRIGNSSKEYLNYRIGNKLIIEENNANNRNIQVSDCGNVYTRYMQPFDNSAGSHKRFNLRGNASDYTYSYFIQIFDSQRNLILDLIPVRVGQTGCLFDKVSNNLYFATTGTPNFGPDYNPFAYQYLTFVPLEDSTFSFAKRGTGNDIEYSIDGGAWTSLASEANTPTVGAGHNIRWRAVLQAVTSGDGAGIGTFSATGLYDAMGNIMSLMWGDNYIGKTTGYTNRYFYKLFSLDTHLYRCNNLILPLAALGNRTYAFMFQNCTSLIIAPTLPASVLATYCYYGMFLRCTKLQYIKMLATDISANNCLYNWVNIVSSTGTLVKNAAMTTLPTGASGIPNGWTVVDDPSTISNS